MVKIWGSVSLFLENDPKRIKFHLRQAQSVLKLSFCIPDSGLVQCHESPLSYCNVRNEWPYENTLLTSTSNITYPATTSVS